MANQKINDIAAAGAVTDAMQFETDIGGVTPNRVTALQIKTYCDDNIWARVGTTISPETAGDDLDMGTGTVTATTGIFNGNVEIDGYIKNPTDITFTPQASPVAITDGSMYYDSGSTKFQFRENGVWVSLGDTSVWDRTGTTISPETAGDDLDLGSGDITATDAHFTGKLTVDGAIDPTMLVLDPQAVAPGTTDGTLYYDSVSTNFQFRENGTWVSLGDTSVWERSGTTISPETAGDDLDMGTGDISCVNLTATGGTTLSSAFVRSTPEVVVSTSFTVAVGNAGALTTLNAATPQIVTFPDGVLVVGTQGTFYNAGTADWTFAAAGSSFVISNEPLSTLPTAEQIFWKKVSSTQYYIFRTRKEGIVYTSGADYNPSILTDDCYIYVNLLTGPQNIIISTEDVQSGSSANLRMFHIKDVTGNAATNNITISLENGGNIDIGTTYVIAMNSGAVTLGLNGATARVISDFNTPSGTSIVWNRSGTTISPITGGDDLSMGAGDISATNAHFTGKLTVDGLIDPTALVLDPQAVAPGTDNGTMYYDSVSTTFKFRENGAWLELGKVNLTDEEQVYSVGPEGSGSNSGLNIEEKMDELTTAVTAIQTLRGGSWTPTESEAVTINCRDAGTYAPFSIDTAIDEYIHVFFPTARIYGSTPVELGDNSSVHFRSYVASVSGATNITKTSHGIGPIGSTVYGDLAQAAVGTGNTNLEVTAGRLTSHIDHLITDGKNIYVNTAAGINHEIYHRGFTANSAIEIEAGGYGSIMLSQLHGNITLGANAYLDVAIFGSFTGSVTAAAGATVNMLCYERSGAGGDSIDGTATFNKIILTGDNSVLDSTPTIPAVILDARGSAPVATDGTIYYNSSSNDFQFRENGAWVTIGTTNVWQRVGTTISPVTAGDDLDMGSGEITTTDTITCGDLYIAGSTPTLRFNDSNSDNYFIKTDGDDELHFSSDEGGDNAYFRFFSKDGDGTDTVAINIFGVGSSSDYTNQEALKIEYNTGYDLFQIYSSNSGTGTLQNLRLGAGTNVTTNQLLLSTDGRVGMNVATPLGQLHVDQDETDGAMPTLVLDQADVSEGFINFIGSDRGVITGATDSVESVRVEINGTVRRIAVYADA